MKEGESIITKLYDDIGVKQIELANIQKKIDIEVNKAKLTSDALHSSRMEQLEHEYEKKRKAQEDQQKYLDDYMMRLNVLQATIASETRVFESKVTIFEDAEKKFRAEKEVAIADVVSRKKANDDERARLEAEAIRISNAEAAFADREIDIVSKQNALSGRLQSVVDREDDLHEKVIDNNEVLCEISRKEESIKQESDIIKKNLDAITVEKDKLKTLEVVKSEVVEVENAKKRIESANAKLQTRSDMIEARQKNVEERETTAKEKERYLLIKEREVKEKIGVLQKIRQGENA